MRNVDCGRLAAASRGLPLTGESIYPGDNSSPGSSRKVYWFSVTFSRAINGLFVRMYVSCPGNLDTVRKQSGDWGLPIVCHKILAACDLDLLSLQYLEWLLALLERCVLRNY